MRPNYTIGLALILVSTSAFSMTAFSSDNAGKRMSEMNEPTVDRDDVESLYDACVEYAEAKDSQGNLYLVFSRRLAKRVETRMSDANIAKVDAYHEIALEWITENQAKLNDRDENSILQACFHVKALLEAQAGLPREVLVRMTKVACYKLVKWLQASTTVLNKMHGIMAAIE